MDDFQRGYIKGMERAVELANIYDKNIASVISDAIEIAKQTIQEVNEEWGDI